MTDILTAGLITGFIGVAAGLGIAIAQKVFFVAEDPRVKEIYDLLPHIDCGACGTAGCMDMANQLVDGKIKSNKCRPSKPEDLALIDSTLASYQEVA